MEASINRLFDKRDLDQHALDTMRRIKVQNDRCMLLQLGENHSIGMGTAEISIWDHELKAIQALVEPDTALLKAAERLHATRVVAKVHDTLISMNFPVGDADDVQAKLEAKEPTVTKIHAEALAQTTSSVEACFRELAGRDLKPLTSLELLSKDPIPSPYQAQQLQQNQMIASLIAQATAKKS